MESSCPECRIERRRALARTALKWARWAAVYALVAAFAAIPALFVRCLDCSLASLLPLLLPSLVLAGIAAVMAIRAAVAAAQRWVEGRARLAARPLAAGVYRPAPARCARHVGPPTLAAPAQVRAVLGTQLAEHALSDVAAPALARRTAS
jgi:hypothetical protein